MRYSWGYVQHQLTEGILAISKIILCRIGTVMVVQQRTCASHLLQVPGPRSLRCHSFLPAAFPYHRAIYLSTTSASLLHSQTLPQSLSASRVPRCSCRMKPEVEAASVSPTPPSEKSLANLTWLPGNVGYFRHAPMQDSINSHGMIYYR